MERDFYFYLNRLLAFSNSSIQNFLTEKSENGKIEIKSNELLDEDGLVEIKALLQISNIQNALMMMQYKITDREINSFINKIINDATIDVMNYYQTEILPANYDKAYYDRLKDNLEMSDVEIEPASVIYFNHICKIFEKYDK